MSKRPARPKQGEPITLIINSKGEAKYRTVLDHGGPNEPRRQRRQTFHTLTEARSYVALIKAQRESGTLVTRDRDTYDMFVDEYLADRKPRVRDITYASYVSSLKTSRQAFGPKRVNNITPGDIEALVRSMADRGLSRRTVSLELMHIRTVLSRALQAGAVVRNAANGIKPLGAEPKKRQSMTVEEYRKVAIKSSEHRLSAAWILTLNGLRRSEVLGLLWEDLTLSGEDPCLRIHQGRTGYGPMLTPPKTRLSARTLPLTKDMLDALEAWRSHLVDTLGLLSVGPTAFVFVDEVGEPYHPERYSNEWVRLCKSAGLNRGVVLHEARHTSVTVMRAAGVPDRIAAAWHGHDESIMRSVYDHADGDRAGLSDAAGVLSSLRSPNNGQPNVTLL